MKVTLKPSHMRLEVMTCVKLMCSKGIKYFSSDELFKSVKTVKLMKTHLIMCDDLPLQLFTTPIYELALLFLLFINEFSFVNRLINTLISRHVIKR